jgi:hypothetical protein
MIALLRAPVEIVTLSEAGVSEADAYAVEGRCVPRTLPW